MFRYLNVIVLSWFAVALAACSGTGELHSLDKDTGVRKVYQVHKLTMPMPIDADWKKPQWRRVEPLNISLYMGDRPEHVPRTQAKLLYDEENIYVIFRVEDRYVKALAAEPHGRVWEDSCVEFFFTPGTDVADGYFNLETNCGGTILCRHQRLPQGEPRFLDLTDVEKIEIAHSLPKVVDPEIIRPITWTLEYRFPIEVLNKYASVAPPKPGAKWRANFYKCADKTSHPHWLTWSFVDRPEPAFHVPEFFGALEFVD